MKTKYSKDELDGIMSEVTEAVDTLLKSEAAALAKTAEGASVQDAQDKKAQGGQPVVKAGEDASAPPDASASSPDASAPAPAADASASAPAPDASASADPAMSASAAPTPEELRSAYSQLSPEEQDAHLAVLQEVVAARSASAQPQASASAPAPAAAPAPGPSTPMPGDQSQGVAPEFAQKFEALQTEHEALKKSLEDLVPALAVVLGQPKTKSITGEDVILGKSQDFAGIKNLSDAEVSARLTKAARTEGLSKSDRQAIDTYYRGQNRDRAIVAHLLK